MATRRLVADCFKRSGLCFVRREVLGAVGCRKACDKGLEKRSKRGAFCALVGSVSDEILRLIAADPPVVQNRISVKQRVAVEDGLGPCWWDSAVFGLEDVG